MYRLLLHASVEKQLAPIPRPFAERLAQAIRALAETPRPTQQLKALGPDLYRLRVGDYRLLYAVFDADQTVFICKVARRSEKTYRDLPAVLAAARSKIVFRRQAVALTRPAGETPPAPVPAASPKKKKAKPKPKRKRR